MQDVESALHRVRTKAKKVQAKRAGRSVGFPKERRLKIEDKLFNFIVSF
jgi:hypothetical protein